LGKHVTLTTEVANEKDVKSPLKERQETGSTAKDRNQDALWEVHEPRHANAFTIIIQISAN
jgi:hypothetical protein